MGNVESEFWNDADLQIAVSKLRDSAPPVFEWCNSGFLNREVIKGGVLLAPDTLVLFCMGVGSALKMWHPNTGRVIVPTHFIQSIDESDWE